MELFIHELTHIALACVVGYFVWKRWKMFYTSFFASFLSSVLVDLDHLFDYLLAIGLNFNLRYFLKGGYFTASQKIIVPFHAWEWIILLLVFYIVTEKFYKKSRTKFLKYALSFILALLLGLYSHLIVDTITNHISLAGYSILYRSINHFNFSSIIKVN